MCVGKALCFLVKSRYRAVLRRNIPLFLRLINHLFYIAVIKTYIIMRICLINIRIYFTQKLIKLLIKYISQLHAVIIICMQLHLPRIYSFNCGFCLRHLHSRYIHLINTYMLFQLFICNINSRLRVYLTCRIYRPYYPLYTEYYCCK